MGEADNGMERGEGSASLYPGCIAKKGRKDSAEGEVHKASAPADTGNRELGDIILLWRDRTSCQKKGRTKKEP